jgi:hypothetical protein
MTSRQTRPHMTFLKDPPSIRRAICDLLGGKQLDMAVAFVGADWEDILGDYEGKVRVICWLSSTNTNPYAVRALRKRDQTTVKQRDSMHCKVYFAPGIGAVVGSANLSKAALNESDTAGQDEAAIFVSGTSALSEIEAWFSEMWRDKHDTKSIEDADIKAAIDAYKEAKAARQKGGLKGKPPHTREPAVPPLPKTLNATLLKYARQAGLIDLHDNMGEYTDMLASLKPEHLTARQRDSIVDLIISWTRHPGSYKRIRKAPMVNVRKGFQLLFDQSIDLQSRLEILLKNGYLAGLRIKTLSLLLYWRYPEKYPPYNHRTVKFLQDFKMKKRGMSDSSPQTYSTWLRWARRLQQQLNLPTPGHVDRMVQGYYADYYEE